MKKKKTTTNKQKKNIEGTHDRPCENCVHITLKTEILDKSSFGPLLLPCEQNTCKDMSLMRRKTIEGCQGHPRGFSGFSKRRQNPGSCLLENKKILGTRLRWINDKKDG